MTSNDAFSQLGEDDFDEPALLVKLTKVDATKLSPYELYEQARGEWAVSFERVKNVSLVFAVYDGRIVEAYRVAGWFPTGLVMRQDENFVPAGGRYEFVGNLASEEVRNRYSGRLVGDLFHGQNPVRYVGGA